MSEIKTACPPAESLLAFASGALTDDRSATIEAHIDGCSDCRATLSNLARGDLPPTFGRYRLDTVLGSGGMGIVYRAWDPQLSRAVAIKVVRRADDDDAGRARLVREAQSLARLSHPNVCHVYDVGTEGDEVWVAMELIDGVTLRQWAQDSASDLVDVLLGAAEGIAAAHAAGLVHRDVKPENVLITRDGRAIVTDFGLARARDLIDPNASTLSTDPHLTSTGAIVGTPAYLAPEQLTGEAIDARVDQFAWAVMAWELIAGMRPFPVVFALRLDAVRAGVTPPPNMPPAIAAALARAMAVAPRDRFPSMRELIDAMIDAIKARPQIVHRRRRALPIAAAVAVLASTAALAAWRFSPAPDRVVAPVAPVASVPATMPATVPAPAPAPVPIPVPAPAPKPKHPKPAAVAVALTHSDVAAIADALDRPLHRSNALASLDSFCGIPYDFAHPDPKTRKPVADWGKVTRVERVAAKLGDRDWPLTLVEVAGQRGNYRFSDEINTLGRLGAKVGDLLVVCSEDTIDLYTLPANWSGPLAKMVAVAPISVPPRIRELAALAPLHIDEIALRRDGDNGKLRLDPARRYLVHAKVAAADGARWDMTKWWLEVPPGIRGAELIAAGKRPWIVVEDLAFEDQPTGKPRLVGRAAAVIDELFP